MRKMTVLGASALLVAGLMGSPAAAFAAPVLTDTEQYLDGVQVCDSYDSGKIDTTGDPEEVTLEAPEGQLITGYCVKAGSAKQGEGEGGAYFVELDEPVAEVTIDYPWGGGRAISHYAFECGEGKPTEEPTPEPSEPSVEPSVAPTGEPSEPAVEPSAEPSVAPTGEPSEPAVEPSTEPSVAPTAGTPDDESSAPVGEVEATTAPSAEEPGELAATGASTVIGFTLIALALVGGGVTLIVLRRKGVLGS